MNPSIVDIGFEATMGALFALLLFLCALGCLLRIARWLASRRKSAKSASSAAPKPPVVIRKDWKSQADGYNDGGAA